MAKIQHRYDTEDRWIEFNPVLSEAEIAVTTYEETGFCLFKIGDGIHAWSELPFFNDYEKLLNKPKINNVEVSGSKTLDDFDIQRKLRPGHGITIDHKVISANMNYNEMANKPRIDGYPLHKNSTTEKMGIVTYSAPTDKRIVQPNDKPIQSKSYDGLTELNLIKLSDDDMVETGDEEVKLNLNSKTRPTAKLLGQTDKEDLSFLSDIVPEKYVIDNNDKVLSTSENGLRIHLGLNYESETGILSLLGRDDSDDNPFELGSVNIPLDTFLEDAGLVVNPEGQPTGMYLLLIFNAQSGKKSIYVNLASLIDIYTGGNPAINVQTDGSILLVVDQNSGLLIGTDGLTFADGFMLFSETLQQEINQAIDDESDARKKADKKLHEAIKEETIARNEAISELTQSINNLKKQSETETDYREIAIAELSERIETETNAREEAIETLNERLEEQNGIIAENLKTAKEYTNEAIANTVVASQVWIPAVDDFDSLPDITDASKTYLCKVLGENKVYQCIAGQDEWEVFSLNADFVDEQELEEALTPIKISIADESQERNAAIDNLRQKFEHLALPLHKYYPSASANYRHICRLSAHYNGIFVIWAHTHSTVQSVNAIIHWNTARNNHAAFQVVGKGLLQGAASVGYFLNEDNSVDIYIVRNSGNVYETGIRDIVSFTGSIEIPDVNAPELPALTAIPIA